MPKIEKPTVTPRVKGLTITMVYHGESMNYNEGFGNLQPLKTITRADGNTYTIASREALGYSLRDIIQWDTTPVVPAGRGTTKVVQYDPSATIAKYPEIDLFGYFITCSKDPNGAGDSDKIRTRSAVCRLNNAVSLEPYQMDTHFQNNMGLSRRGGHSNAIVQKEIHSSFYAYTASIDLERVGVDGNVSIGKEEKKERVKVLLDGLKLLSRDIKGRRENLSPLFVIGGVYDHKNPFFQGRIVLDQGAIKAEPLLSALSLDDELPKRTIVGLTQGVFRDEEGLRKALKGKVVKVTGIREAFDDLKNKVGDYYDIDPA